MTERISVRPPNSLILVRDAEHFDVPSSWSGKSPVEATETCVAIGTLAEPDGETMIWFGDEAESLPVEAFKGDLRLPSGRLVVSTVGDEILLTKDIGRQRVNLRVLTNDASEPNEIAIIVG